MTAPNPTIADEVTDMFLRAAKEHDAGLALRACRLVREHGLALGRVTTREQRNDDGSITLHKEVHVVTQAAPLKGYVSVPRR